MSFPGFTPSDFKVFDIDGFEPRMDAIKTPDPAQARGGRHASCCPT